MMRWFVINLLLLLLIYNRHTTSYPSHTSVLPLPTQPQKKEPVMIISQQQQRNVKRLYR